MKTLYPESNENHRKVKEWPYLGFVALFMLTAVLQLFYFPFRGNVNYNRSLVIMAVSIYTIVFIRVVIAKIRHETNNLWVFYAILLFSSWIWISLLFELLV